MRPDLDQWCADPTVRVSHRRSSEAGPELLWRAASDVRLSETRVLSRLIRWRIPGVSAGSSFDELFRGPPFTVLQEQDGALVSGLVGKIWTLRRDYPELAGPEEFRRWSTPGTVRVVLANWVEPEDSGGATLVSDSRIAAPDTESRLGLAAVRPLVAAFQHLIASEAFEAALRRAERTGPRPAGR